MISNIRRTTWMMITVFVSLCIALLYTFQSSAAYTYQRLTFAVPTDTTQRHVAIIYLMDDHDPLYRYNMLYFIEQTVMMNSTSTHDSVTSSDAVDYFFIIQSNDKDTFDNITSWLPPLPSNAQMTWHPNHCFDWGTFGWFLNLAPGDTIHQSFDDAPEWDSRQQPRLKHTIEYYDYFMFVNSGVRGPFFPTYYRPTNWYDPFIQPIINTRSDKYPTKLVGCNMCCMRDFHVQSYVVATDRVGMQHLRNTQAVAFECHTTMEDTVMKAEYGISRAMFHHGYNIEALALFWRGINLARQFAEPDSMKIDVNSLTCAAQRDVRWQGFPDETGWAEYEYDPLEVVFAKVQHKLQDFPLVRQVRMKAVAQSNMNKVAQQRIRTQDNLPMTFEAGY